jgi:hypothetical protein
MKTRYVSEKLEKWERLGAVNQVSENKAVKKQIAAWVEKMERSSRTLNVGENTAT